MSFDKELFDTTRLEQKTARAPLRPGAPMPVQTAPEKTDSLAITALVLACVSVLCGMFTAVPAVICGHVARSRMKKGQILKGKGMATAALIIGYVFIIMSAIWIATTGGTILITLIKILGLNRTL